MLRAPQTLSLMCTKRQRAGFVQLDMRGGDPVTATYMGRASEDWPTILQILEGSWAGLRCMWVYALAFCWLAVSADR